MTPEVKAALRETIDNFVLWTDNTPHSNEPTELGVYFGQLDEGEVVDRLADELVTAIQPEVERLVLEANEAYFKSVIRSRAKSDPNMTFKEFWEGNFNQNHNYKAATLTQQNQEEGEV